MNDQPEQRFMYLLMSAIGDDERPDARAKRARVRRGAGNPDDVAGVSSVIEPLLGRVEQQVAPSRLPVFEDLAYLIAPLYALHPQHTAEGSIGTHVRQLAGSGDDSIPPAVERRFVTLLSTGDKELLDVLRPVIMLLKAHGIPVNWPQLFTDLLSSTQSDKRRNQVRRTWARDFWRDQPSEQAAPIGEATSTDKSDSNS